MVQIIPQICRVAGIAAKLSGFEAASQFIVFTYNIKIRPKFRVGLLYLKASEITSISNEKAKKRVFQRIHAAKSLKISLVLISSPRAWRKSTDWIRSKSIANESKCLATATAQIPFLEFTRAARFRHPIGPAKEDNCRIVFPSPSKVMIEN